MILQDTARAPFAARLQESFRDVFGDAIPALFFGVIILVAGYLVAKLLEFLADRLLRRVGLNRMLDRAGILEAMERSGARFNATRVLSGLVFWLVMFAAILVLANTLRLESLANVVSELTSYIPSVIVAIVIIIVGIMLGQFVGGLVAASAGAITGGRALARLGNAGVIVVAVFMALQQLNIATEIVSAAFAILFGAVALALALAFGLGNRDLAGEITREWYERYKAERRESEARAAALQDELDEADEDDGATSSGGAPKQR